MAIVHIDPDWETKLQPAIVADLERRAYLVENAAKLLLATPPKSGRVYTQFYFTRIRDVPRGTPGRLGVWGSRPPHQASAPGEPPASDYGLLLNSLHHVVGFDGEGPYTDIGSDLRYSVYLELGTRYMEPRPFLRPALVAAE